MNEQLELAVTKLIQKALDGIDTAGNFLAGEIPEVIYQLLLWHGVASGLWCLLGVGIALWAIPSFINNQIKLSNYHQCYKDKEPWTLLPGYTHTTSFEYDIVVGNLTWGKYLKLIIGSLVIAANLDWLKILIAPKLYLLEYAANLAN